MFTFDRAMRHLCVCSFRTGWLLACVAALWCGNIRAQSATDTPGAAGQSIGKVAWPEGSYTYYADRKPVSGVLRDFATNFGLTLRISPRVTGLVNGRIQAAAPADFLDRLAGTNGFIWFRHEGTIYVSRIDEQTSRQFQIAANAIGGVRSAVREMGLLNDKFGWAELPAQGTIVVSGPAPYVDLVAHIIARLDPSTTDWRVAVIRLKHARVDDRTFQERDRSTVIPGVATILRNLIAGMRSSAGNAAAAGRVTVGAPLAGLSGLPGLLAEPSARPSPAAASAIAAAPSAGGVIEADVRLNAVVVRDVPTMIPVYEQIIQQLDVPTSLVQIEAMIVDISKDRMHELGIDWTVNAGRATASLGDPTVALTSGTLGLALASKSVVNQVQSLLARIRLLEQQGEAQVLSKPMLLTTDNSTALIDLSETFYTRVSGERTANLVPVTAGVMLKVTPHVIVNSLGVGTDVQLTVDIEDGALDSRKGVELPIVKRNTISTQAVIKVQHSLLIGGFNSQRNERAEQRVPFLGDLPVVGQVFRSNSIVDNHRERLFLITPTVLTQYAEGQPAGLAQAPASAPMSAPVFHAPLATEYLNKTARVPLCTGAGLSGGACREPTVLLP